MSATRRPPSARTRRAANIIEKAHEEADEIVAQAKKENPDYDPVVEAILKEYSADQ